MPERWKAVRGHRGYEASDLGRVRSVDRTLRDGRTAGGTVLVPTRDKDGYQRVKLGRHVVPVHVAVALAWHGPPEVRHLNGDQDDCTPGNLAWGSRRENERDKWRGKGGNEGDGIGKASCPEKIVPGPVSPVTKPIRLSEAVALGVVSGTLTSIRMARHRHLEDFPGPASYDGLAHLYDPAELAAWEVRRRA